MNGRAGVYNTVAHTVGLCWPARSTSLGDRGTPDGWSPCPRSGHLKILACLNEVLGLDVRLAEELDMLIR